MKNKIPGALAAVIPVAIFAAALIYKFRDQPRFFGERYVLPTGESAKPGEEELYPFVIPPQTSLYNVLRNHKVDPATIKELVIAAKEYADLSRIQPGTRFQLVYSPPSHKEAESYFANTPLDPGPSGESEDNELIGVQFRFSPVEKLHLSKESTGWRAERIVEKIDIDVVTFSGVVTDTLWASAEKAKMDPNLISELSEIFAWQVDFAREVRVNDRWRLAVERKLVKGQPIGWGSILAAEYQNGSQLYSAFLLRLDGENKGYYAADGTSLRRMFLKSPIHFARISSRFQKHRFHPILKVHRPHNGVDYAARRGTPVRAVGDGVVTVAGYNGGAGNMIRIRHNSTYETAYKHLHNFARGIRKGARVKQGQVIGYVGSTGLSTAPHLHFEFFQNGRYVDPLGRKFPSADPVAAQHMDHFQTEAAVFRNALPPWEQSEEVTDGTSEVANASSLNN